MVDMVSYLNGAKDFFIFHEEKERTIYSIRIFIYISRDNIEKFLIIHSGKKLAWTRRSRLEGLPLFEHELVARLMRDVGESEVEHLDNS